MESKSIKQKISFCTVCMNRLDHLKQTLPKNIKDNIGYGNVEFLVLDYNSSDGLEEWVETEMKEYINNGILSYYKTTQPTFFHRSHSRNMLLKHATGDILCNVDADNFIGSFFASYVNKQFTQDPSILLAIDVIKQAKHAQAHGKFCAWKEDFLSVTGYDESMDSYGYEDIDLYNRIELLGRKRVAIDDLFLTYISHGNEQRGQNEALLGMLDKFLIRYVNESKTEIILLSKNNRFEKMILNQPKEPSLFQVMASIEHNSYKLGTWKQAGTDIILEYRDEKKETMLYTDDSDSIRYLVELPAANASLANMIPLAVGHKEFMLITHDKFITNFMIGYSRIINLEKLKKNIETKTLAINKGEIGKGTLYKNFGYELLQHA